MVVVDVAVEAADYSGDAKRPTMNQTPCRINASIFFHHWANLIEKQLNIKQITNSHTQVSDD